MPSVGRIERVRCPQGPGVRNDSGHLSRLRGAGVLRLAARQARRVGRRPRAGAPAHAARARRVRARGLQHNLAFHRWLCAHPEFAAGQPVDALPRGALHARVARAGRRGHAKSRCSRRRCTRARSGSRVALPDGARANGGAARARWAERRRRPERGDEVLGDARRPRGRGGVPHRGRARWLLEVEGRRIEADFRRLPDGEVYSLLVNGHSHEVRVAPGRRSARGRRCAATTIPVEVRHPLEKMLQRARCAGGGAAAARPIARAHARAGGGAARQARRRRWRAGQSVVVVEAMKMQNELVARRTAAS